MLFVIIFGLVFLAGVSLFVAAVGMAFLKKHAQKSVEATDLSLSESDYRDRFSSEYAQQIAEKTEEAFAEERAEALRHGTAAARPAPFPESTAGRTGGKWAFIIVGILAVITVSLIFGIRGVQGMEAKPRLYFCEDIDFTKLKPVHKSNTFTRGTVTLFIKSRTPLDLEGATVEVYKYGTQRIEPVASRMLPLKPEWTSFSVKILFDTIGTYTVSIFGKDGKLLNQKNINIVPDSFAYKPVPAGQ